jgi:hypothetical protein
VYVATSNNNLSDNVQYYNDNSILYFSVLHYQPNDKLQKQHKQKLMYKQDTNNLLSGYSYFRE